MAASSRRIVKQGERGAISWVTAFLLAALAGGAYLAAVWGPIWIVHYEVRAVVRDYANQAVKNGDDAGLVERMCQKLASLDAVRVPADDGSVETRPAVDLHPQEVVWEREGSGESATLHVAFDYHRSVHYPLLDRWQEVTMRFDDTLDIGRPNWGPPR
jgi:hypothetical protein